MLAAALIGLAALLLLTPSSAAAQVDKGFGSDGIVTTDFDNRGAQGQAVAVQSDGKIVVAGYTGKGSNYHFAVVRYLKTAPPALTGLSLTDGTNPITLTPVFDGATTSYTATVPQSVSSVVVHPAWTETGSGTPP